MGLESVFNQIFQPYFYYSALLLIISFICIRLLSKYCFFMNSSVKGITYFLPLIIPIVVMLVYTPSPFFWLTRTTLTALLAPDVTGAPYKIGYVAYSVAVPSVTGIICMIGIAIGCFFAASMVIFNNRVAKRVLHVVEAEPDDYPWLQKMVAECSAQLKLSVPKIGFVDDLKPNAFNIGYGKGTTIVFSIGLLELLEKDEVSAVILHELSHVKNYDFFYKTLSGALTAVSFFNPFAYLSASALQRERELLADEKAANHLKEPSVLGSAIAKISAAIQNFPKESFFVGVTSNLFVTSSMACKPRFFAVHPSVSERLANISMPPKQVKPSKRKILGALVIFLVIISVSVSVCYVLADVPRLIGYPNAGYEQLESVGVATTSTPLSGSDGSVGSPLESPVGK